jgi:hypothetical protein
MEEKLSYMEGLGLLTLEEQREYDELFMEYEMLYNYMYTEIY